MPSFLSKVLKRDGSKKGQNLPVEPQKPKWEDGWMRTEVEPEEVQELLRGCTREIKSRGLTTPFIILPYRPEQENNASRPFIRQYFNPRSTPPTGEQLKQELRLTEPEVLISAIKWCWSRLPGGVVTWDVYELFRQGEVDSSMARDSFATFIPISAESEARAQIIFDYFDILSAIAAHAKSNGLGGLKLSRMAGWWAFEHSDTGFGFEGGYASWQAAADATCHLFFAYMRSLSPEDPSKAVTLLPTSLRALVASIDYPPVTPPQLQAQSVRICLTVDKLAPSPFALVRRAKNHQYRPGNSALRIFTDYDDPVKALTEECRRVLKAIASSASTGKGTSGLQEKSWSRFEDLGFSGLLDDSPESDDDDGLPSSELRRTRRELETIGTGPLTPPRVLGEETARPTTPSWADFMDGGFGERHLRPSAPPLLLPPDKVLPPLESHERVTSSASNRRDELDPGDLESVAPMEIDEAFWWVWMSSLAGEETAGRKAVFGRCALVETNIKGCKWLVVEEKVRGAAKLDDPSLLKKDKRRFKMTLRRKKDTGRSDSPSAQPMKQFNPSVSTMNRSNLAPEQSAKIQAAAAALREQRTADGDKDKPTSPIGNHGSNVFTLQPMVVSEATSAMKWANQYDKHAIRDAYLQGKPAPKLPAAEQQEEPSTPPPPPLKDSPVLRPSSPKNNSNRHTMLPSTPSTNGRDSPVTERPVSIDASPKSQASSINSNLKVDRDGKQKVSRLKAMFGKKEAEANQSRLAPPKLLDRRPSLRKHTPVQVSMPAHVEPEPTYTPPAATTPTGAGDHLQQESIVKPTFSSFDQGPVDMPAFVPESPPLSPSASESPVPALEPAQDDAPKPSPAQAEQEESAPVPLEDRWAQIRKNAAERAKAAPKQAEISITSTQPSVDGGETSGEESIESRVARIKARVAELTGNPDVAPRHTPV